MPTNPAAMESYNTESPGFSWQPNLGLLALGALLLWLLFSLSLWQFSRAEEKQQLLETLEKRLSLSPIQIDDYSAQKIAELPAYTVVSFQGTADNEQMLLLDNKIEGGRFGYHVIQIVQTNHTSLLINRGWIAGSLRRDEKPSPSALKPMQLYIGRIAPANVHSMLHNEPLDSEFPKRYNQISITDISAQLSLDIGNMVELSPESYGAQITNWPKINVSPSKHYGYAVQWLCMGLALLILLFFANTNLSVMLKYHRLKKQK